MSHQPPDHVMQITQLREFLGVAYMKVKETDEPIIIQRYSAQDVAMVPLWEWRFLKQIEADIRAGKCPWQIATRESAEKLDGLA